VRAILDTSVLIDGPAEPISGEIAISAVSLAELHFGVLVARTADERANRLRRLGGIERAFEPLPVDDAVARAYGRLAATVAENARQARSPTMDLLIAATAYVHEAKLYTRNAKDLRGLEDLVDIVAL
jgi:predicted nucleic acid-binding protein